MVNWGAHIHIFCTEISTDSVQFRNDSTECFSDEVSRYLPESRSNGLNDQKWNDINTYQYALSMKTSHIIFDIHRPNSPITSVFVFLSSHVFNTFWNSNRLRPLLIMVRECDLGRPFRLSYVSSCFWLTWVRSISAFRRAMVAIVNGSSWGGRSSTTLDAFPLFDAFRDFFLVLFFRDRHNGSFKCLWP